MSLAIEAAGASAFLWLGDLVSLLGSASIVLAVARLRGRWPSPADLVDTAIVAMVGGLVLWVLAVAPAMAGRVEPLSTAIALASPALSLFALGLLVGLVLESERRSIGLGLLSAAIGLLLATATVDACRVLAGSDDNGIAVAVSLTGYVLLASAANDPSLLVRLPRTSPLGIGPRRFIALAAAALAAPVVGAVEWATRGRVDPVVATVGAGTLSCLVLVRLALAGRALMAAVTPLAAQKELDGGREGTLAICASCKRIRDEAGRWIVVEQFLGERSALRFSHGLCDDCLEDELRRLP